MFYRFWRTLIVGLARLLFALQVTGRDRLPRRGVYILAPSHRSTLDIPFAASVTTRRLRFMAKRELFAHPFWHWVFDQLGAVPVDRTGNDRAALRATEAALKQGEPVVIFPEGTRHDGRQLAPLFSGAAYLALKLGVPIVPVGIGGSEDPVVKYGWFSWWSRVCVVVGEPIVPPPFSGSTVKRSAITAMNDSLRAGLQACLDEANARSDARSGRQARESV
jgi:1-acyl-sn-glycerol-3-phosphate acyltransferase